MRYACLGSLAGEVRKSGAVNEMTGEDQAFVMGVLAGAGIVFAFVVVPLLGLILK